MIKEVTKEILERVIREGKKIPSPILVVKTWYRTSTTYSAGYNYSRSACEVIEIEKVPGHGDDPNKMWEVLLIVIPERVGAYFILDEWDWEGEETTVYLFTENFTWKSIATSE